MKLIDLLEDYDEQEEYGKGDVGYLIQNYESLKSLLPEGTKIELHNKRIIAQNCDLTSMKGSPSELYDFDVSKNLLRNVEGSPLKSRLYDCSSNRYLTSVQDAPVSVRTFKIDGCDLSSLEGLGRKYVKECEYLYISNNPFKSHLLGITLIKNLNTLFFTNSSTKDRTLPWIKAASIIKDSLTFGEKDMLDIQEELITQGYKDFAKL